MGRRWLHWIYAPVALIVAILVGILGGGLGQVAVLLVLVGMAIRWPAAVGRFHPLLRGGVLLCLVTALQVGWFLFGWTAYHPACFGSGWFIRSYQLMGPLSPEAVDYLTRDEDQFRRRGGETGVLVNPLKGMIQGEYSWNNTTQAAFGIAATYGLPAPDRDADDGCDAIERIMMMDGRAAYRSLGWGLWPYTTVDENGPLGKWLWRWERELRSPL